MIDEQKIIGLLQAKALGCLDSSDEEILSDFINGGHLFPWDELGALQSVASLLPISLPLELPDPSLKDKIALRLIKLTEEIRAQKIIQEEKQILPEVDVAISQEPDFIEEEFEQQIEELNDTQESAPEQQGEFEEVTGIKIEIPDFIEEEFEQQIEELNDTQESAPEQQEEFEEVTGIKIEIPDVVEKEFEPQIEELNDTQESAPEQQGEFEEVTGIKTEIPDIIEENNFNMEIEEATFNLDDVVLPDYDLINTSETEFDQIEQPNIENITEKPFEEPPIETQPIDTVEPFKELPAEISFDHTIKSSEEELTESLPIETALSDAVESFNEQFIEKPVSDTDKAFEEPLTNEQASDIVEQSEEPMTESAETYTQSIEPLLGSETIVEQTEKTQEEVTEQVQNKAVRDAKTIAESDTDSEKQPDLTKRSVADKLFKAIEQDFDSLKFHYERSEAKLKRGLLVSYVVIAVLFLLLIFSFFKLSGDVNNLLDEIKSLKKNTSSFLIKEKNINSFYQFFG
jgi:hypothetical protein